MLRGRSDLPLKGDASGRFLPCIAAAMVYLAALALAGVFAVNQVVDRWQAALTGTLTIEIPPQAAKSQAEERLQRERTSRALDLLRATSGIASAEPIDRERTLKLIEPWLGEGALVDDLPLPVLIEVALEKGASIDMSALANALAREVPEARLDDHTLWLGGIATLARGLEGMAAMVLAIVAAVAVAAVVFATRTGLAIHRDVVEVLHLIGARDRYIARQFAEHVFRLSLAGGLVGLALAVATLLGVSRIAGLAQHMAIPGLELGPIAWIAIALLPLAAGAIAILTARISVARRLARLP